MRFQKDFEDVSLLGALFMKLNRARNDFLHGNDIPEDALHFVEYGHNILNYCAPLYRIALTTYLGLEFALPMPDINSDAEGLGKWIAQRMDFQGPQTAIELALLTATEKAKRPGD